MKIFLILIALILFISCKKKEEKKDGIYTGQTDGLVITKLDTIVNAISYADDSQTIKSYSLDLDSDSIPDLKFIIHYQLPHKSEEFTHRNGRTARMQSEGSAYVIKWEKEQLPDFIEALQPSSIHRDDLIDTHTDKEMTWETIFISGGRKDKISKGDIAGLFFKQGNLGKDDLGIIELKNDCAFVAVRESKADFIIDKFNNTRIKKKKVRVRRV